MTTSHNEKYVCQLPIEESKQEAKDEEYTVSEKSRGIQNRGMLSLQLVCN